MHTLPPRRILVATDLSEESGLAVRRAAQLGEQHGAQVTALHVVSSGIDPELVDYVRSRLSAHVRQSAAGFPVEATTRFGSVTAELAAEVDDRGVDLLVVGAYGTHRRADALLGSTAENAVRLAKFPVLVVRSQPRTPYKTVLLAVDSSATSITAARAAGALTPQAHHVVTHVTTVLGENLLRMRGFSEHRIAELREVSTEKVRPRLDELATNVAPQPAKVVIDSGRPEDTLPQLAERLGADLVATGAGDHSRLAYALLGSVAHHVVRRARCDVLVVPRSQE
jgi:nucleotide-binding universal stress UspA family protein